MIKKYFNKIAIFVIYFILLAGILQIVAGYDISGYVTNASSGLPLDNVIVMTNTSLSTATNVSGFYNFTGLSNGTYNINASLAGYDTNSTNATVNGADVTDVNISLSSVPVPTYLISGYVFNVSGGLPLDNVIVMTNTSLSTTTNVSGFYNFTGLSNGTYNINANLAGYDTNSTNATVSGENITNVNISISPLSVPTFLISGYVTNASSGLPLDNAAVMTNTSLVTTTDVSGFYIFTGIFNGTYIINANLAGYNTNSTNVIINGSDVTDANISLSVSAGGGGDGGGGSGSITYKISGYVRDSYTLKGLNKVNITTDTNKKTTTDSTGFYIFSGLTNGSYIINTSFFGYFENFITISINGTDISDADIYLTLAPIPCTDCHYSFNYMNDSVRPDLYVNQTMADESVHVALDCKDCHTDTTVHPPPKSGWKWCEDCHASQQNPQTDKKRHNIVNNPWNNLYNGTSTVNITSCTTCHDPIFYNNSKNIYGKQTGIDCDYCHTFPDNNIG